MSQVNFHPTNNNLVSKYEQNAYDIIMQVGI